MNNEREESCGACSTAKIQPISGELSAARERVMAEQANADAWDALGEVAWSNDAHGEARGAFSRAADIDSHNPRRWLKLGIAERCAEDLARSEAALSKAFQLEPTNPEIARELAVTKMLQGRFPSASVMLDLATQVAPNDVSSLLSMARCHYEMGDLAAAVQKYSRVTDLDPGNEDARSSLEVLSPALDVLPLSEGTKILCKAKAARPFTATAEMLERAYPCPYPFSQLYMVPRQHLDLRFCSYHAPVIIPDQKEVYAAGHHALSAVMHGHAEFDRRRERFLAGDYKGAGCSENCIWLNRAKVMGLGFRLRDYLAPTGKFEVKKIWLSMGPDCNVRCRYCLDTAEFKMDFNTCDPDAMRVAIDFVRSGGELLLTGGETFLPKWGFVAGLERLIAWGDAKGRISLHTNGTYLDERTRAVVLKAPINTIGVSMDTLRKDLYEYIRRGTSYDLVWNNVTSMLRERNERGLSQPQIILLCAVLKCTADHIRETVDRAVEAGLGISLNALFQSYYSPDFSAAQGLHQLELPALQKLYDDVLAIEQKYGEGSPVAYQGFKGQVENLIAVAKSGKGEAQVVLGGGGHAPRLEHFRTVAAAEARIAAGEYTRALQLLEPVLPKIRRSPRAMRAWAKALNGSGRRDEAIHAWREVERLDPHDRDALAEVHAYEERLVGISTQCDIVETTSAC